MSKQSDVQLDDVFTATSGSVLMSGIQALVRLTLEQRWLDAARGLSTAGFVSGYPGSPLGGVDLEFERAARFLDPAGVRFQSGLNEELAATAVAGTQFVDQLPGARYDGVVGYWFGKNPGLDRAADAIRHGNYAGTTPLGGAVAMIGDDPSSKSSTLPSSSAEMCESLMVPAFNPSTVGELVTYGLHAVAMSRAAGTFTALRVVTDLADAAAVVTLSDPATFIPAPDPERFQLRHVLLGAKAVEAERDLFERRIPLATAYAKAHGLNEVTFEASRPALGIIASGVTYAMVLRGFEILGVDDAALEQMGVRLIKIGLIWPLDHAEFRSFTNGLSHVFVVEDKRPFLELHIRDALYGAVNLPVILGKHDEDGSPLVPSFGSMDVDGVVEVVAKVLARRNPPPAVAAAIERVQRPRTRIALTTIPVRQPYFCSGCPHNRSTQASNDTLVGVGIGCHVMVAFQQEQRGHKVGMTQMGGEGTQWIGMAPFTDDAHYTQNLGDGTFFHSGSLAIRAAVVAGVNVTYKLLYNRAVAMTGGQRPTGVLEVPALTAWLALEGVAKVVVTTPDPRTYDDVRLDPIATVRHRDDLPDVEAELAATPGVTVLLHDDRCAAEERRLRRRGTLATPPTRIAINERVCEGCGDCQRVSTCLSLLPVETPYGDKTRVHQSSCNLDESCANGDCPSFVRVLPGEREAHVVPDLPLVLTAPSPPTGRIDATIRMTGVGGTGVVTVSRVLQMAARLDGLAASGLDQTGMAQKGGPVISDVRIADHELVTAPKASTHMVDLVLGFDLLGALNPGVADEFTADRTVAVLNLDTTPTHDQLLRKGPATPTASETHALIEPVTKADRNVYLHALTIAEAVVGDHLAANFVLFGAAFQAGCIPLRAEAIEQAIALNGTAVAGNLAAFRWGRAAVLDPAAVDAVVRPRAAEVPRRPRPTALAEAIDAVPVSVELSALLGAFADELVAYQSARYALDYVAAVSRVASSVTEVTGAAPFVEAYVRGAFKLRAYKDEYEVARLHRDPVERAKVQAQFGKGAKVSVLLHPPLLRGIGMRRKVELGVLAGPTFAVLARLRWLRGTPVDPFGATAVRRVERALVTRYDAWVDQAVAFAISGDVDRATEIAALADQVRGYESVKLANVARVEARAAELLDRVEVGV